MIILHHKRTFCEIRTGLSTLLLNRLKCMLLETFKSTRHLIAECLHGIFKTRVVPYDLRTTNLVQPKRQSTTYGLRSFSYLGSRLWNELVKDYPFLCEIDYVDFQEFIKQWGGPNLDDGFCYVSFLHFVLFKWHTVVLSYMNIFSVL